jgi:hypothetical protein
MTSERRTLACGCVLGYERCIDCRPGLHRDQETALAMTLPHAYVPSIMHMGDCSVCGHLQGDSIHSPSRRDPPADA